MQSATCYGGCYVNPTCYGGCYVHPWGINWQWQPQAYINPATEEMLFGLTDLEKEILNELAKSWELFSSLEEKHPSDDLEFLQAIHAAQKMIALRVARRVNKDVWKQFNSNLVVDEPQSPEN